MFERIALLLAYTATVQATQNLGYRYNPIAERGEHLDIILSLLHFLFIDEGHIMILTCVWPYVPSDCYTAMLHLSWLPRKTLS